MSAVTVLSPLPGERILDLCAAPGGKSTQIAACLQGQGLLWSNEYGRSRAQILLQNLERCGVANAVVSSADAGTIGGGLPRFFDGVLVDAPCSGEGMFRKEPEALAQWSEDNIRLCAARQREILHAAAETVRPGGRLIYSTCTFAPEENVTRQQMAAFMQNYAEAMGYTLPKTHEAVTFADSASIADWAAESVRAMQMAGVIMGKDKNCFDPTGTATRAEAAAVLRRYVELVIDPAAALQTENGNRD